MNVQKIMARFLPLMDLSILLLGMFMVVLSIAQFNDYNVRVPDLREPTNNPDTDIEDREPVFVLKSMKFLPVYACCKTGEGREAGHCYQLNSALNPTKEIRMDTDEDIKRIIKESQFKEDNPPIVCLITVKGAWDADWSREKIRTLEEIWKCGHIYRVINMDKLPFNE